MSIQTNIDSLISGVSLFNLALNVAGIINNKKNVALYVIDEKTQRKTNILEGALNVQITLQAQDYKDKLSLLKKYKDENQMIYVETKFGGYKNMQIVNMPCNMNFANINRLTFNVKLREVLIMGEQTPIPENVSDSDTINTGTQTGILQPLNSVVFG